MSPRNRWLIGLPVALLLVAGCVDRRVFVFVLPATVQQASIPAPSTETEARPGGPPATRTLALPICQMTACDTSTQSCQDSVRTAVRSAVAQSPVSALRSVRTITPLGQHSFVTTVEIAPSRVEAAATAWAGAGCVRNAGSALEGSSARFEVCRKAMPQWVSLLNDKPPALLTDVTFRQACEYEIMGFGGAQ